ncbi:MAG TPA: UpxY family transcription antiterminator [Bryobacteraceae bacterium]|nr:UpxY family transcription antiterminator [Bryobacteraceae bacterium]
MQSWFALTAKPRHEKSATRILSIRGLQPFLPVYRAQHQWSDRVKSIELPLFPGYIFCRFDYAHRWTVLSTPGVNSIIGFDQAPAPVPDAEIDRIQAIVASGLPARPWQYIQAGDAIRIHRGSLAGLEGVLVREKDTMRVVVSVGLLRRSVAVEIDRNMIGAAAPAH